MKIGNIVSTTKVKVSDDFNVVTSMDKIIQGLPTLIVGWEEARKLPNYNILEKKISEKLYWTFKVSEKRDKHEMDIQWFIAKAYSDIVLKTSYIFVDPVQYDTNKLYKIIRKIKSLDNPIAYIHGEMIYIYGEKLIFGIDLKLLRYMGLNTEKLITKVKKLSKTFLEDNEVTDKYKSHIDSLNGQVKYIPFLYSINNL